MPLNQIPEEGDKYSRTSGVSGSKFSVQPASPTSPFLMKLSGDLGSKPFTPIIAAREHKHKKADPDADVPLALRI